MSRQAAEREQPRARATRFPIAMPLRYREAGEADWQVGKVENISRSGVLFTVGNLLGVNTRLEMAFDLPVLLEGTVPGHVYCEGQVVRTVLPAATDRQFSVAAHIQKYKLMPTDKPPDI